jgi:insulysin
LFPLDSIHPDPPELPGLAHFCEHLLFCGSQRWPAENEYSAYLKKHGGDCNASTTAEYTTYDLTIMEAAKLGGALDRMAALFTAPLFEASVVEREIKAINSEFERHRQSDSWRFDQIQASLSKKGHPWAKFGCGNLKTLLQDPKAKGINLRKELIKFHAENCASTYSCGPI